MNYLVSLGPISLAATHADTSMPVAQREEMARKRIEETTDALDRCALTQSALAARLLTAAERERDLRVEQQAIQQDRTAIREQQWEQAAIFADLTTHQTACSAWLRSAAGLAREVGGTPPVRGTHQPKVLTPLMLKCMTPTMHAARRVCRTWPLTPALVRLAASPLFVVHHILLLWSDMGVGMQCRNGRGNGSVLMTFPAPEPRLHKQRMHLN